MGSRQGCGPFCTRPRRSQPGTFHRIPEALPKCSGGSRYRRQQCQEVTLKQKFGRPKPPCSRQGLILQPPTLTEKGGPSGSPTHTPTRPPPPSHTPPFHRLPCLSPSPPLTAEAQAPAAPRCSEGSAPPHHPAWGGSLPPGRPPHCRHTFIKALQWDPGASPTGLPSDTLGSAASRPAPAPQNSPHAAAPPRRPPPRPPAEIVETLQTHPPLRWEWNSPQHPSTLREPAPASSTSPAPRVVLAARSPPNPTPPRGRMVLPASHQLSRNWVPPRPLQWRAPALNLPPHHRRRPPAPREWKGPARPPTPGVRTMAGRPVSTLTFGRLPPPFRGLRPPPPQRRFLCSLPRDRRPPTRKCPGVTPAAAAMETLPAPVPPPPPSWTHNEARRCPARPRAPLPPQPSCGPSVTEA